MKITKHVSKGFSLVEVVIAIGIVAILLTTFMAVFGPAQQNINRAIGVSDANRLVSTLENEMAVLRLGEENEYQDADGNASAFEKAFQWIQNSNGAGDAILIYQYQALPDESNQDGTLQAIEASDAQDENLLPGKDYITQTTARRVSFDPYGLIEKELVPGVVSGNVYVARMTQLLLQADKDDIDDDGDRTELVLQVGDAGKIKFINEDGTETEVGDSSDYNEAYITVQVEFFQMPNNLAGYVTGGGWDFDELGSPVAVHNIAVRR
ncbi:prepilin-type N-terminal cleavage/methylation domain-containing protein [Rubritalea spongiae]|uniref:Prepilin-type N-terminal cleavage/methylation domain-containing protein n=1 Tax=Rubritalea spongiae TaxID=430797 RepID=A0ABW5E239_9BACT